MSQNKNSMNNNAGYKTSNGNVKTKKPIDNKRGLKAWEDDEKKNEVKSVETPKKAEQQIKDGRFASNTMQSKAPSYEQKPLSYDYENRIIDDALEVSGISTKPTEGQLSEFIKRIRSLNKDVIWLLMNNRLSKYTAEANVNDIKSLTNILCVVERILKDNATGYLEIIKSNAQFFQDLFNRNYNKKINIFCSSIFSILTGQTLLIQEDNMANEKKLNEKSNSNSSNSNVMNLFSSTPIPVPVVNQNVDMIKDKKEPPSKYQFIKKKQTESVNSINQDMPNLNQIPVDLFNNLQTTSIQPTTTTAITTTTPTATEPKKPRLFNFINSKKTNEINTHQQQQSNNGSDVLSQLNELNFDLPLAQPISEKEENNSNNKNNNIIINGSNTNDVINKKELDMELFAKCYNENQMNQHNMMHQNNNQHGQLPLRNEMDPLQCGYLNHQPLLIPLNGYPNGVMYPYPQMYNIPPPNNNMMYNMPQPYNPLYQPQHYAGNSFNQPSQYQEMMRQNNYPQQVPSQTNGKLPDNNCKKGAKEDPFGNLLDFMKSK